MINIVGTSDFLGCGIILISYQDSPVYKHSLLSHPTPTYSTHLSFANRIERHLGENSHHSWGFIIHRRTYDSHAN